MGSCAGNNYVADEEFKNMKQIQAQFQVPMPFKDDFQVFQTLQQMEILQHSQLSQYQVLYAHFGGAQVKMSEQITSWQQKTRHHNHPNLLSIHAILVEEGNRLFIPFNQITLLVDCPINLLSRHKKLISKEGLNEDDIWHLLDCVVAGLAFQQEMKIYPASFEIDDIVIVNTPFGEQVYKLVDRYFKPQKTNQFQEFIQQFDDKIKLSDLKKVACLSPQQVLAIPQRDRYLKQNRYKADVFILALLCLQVIFVQRIELYDWKMWSVDEQQLTDHLDRLTAKHISDTLRRFLERMLIINEAQRPDFIQLNAELTKCFQMFQRERLLEQHDPSEFLLSQQKTDNNYVSQVKFPTYNLVNVKSQPTQQTMKAQFKPDMSILSQLDRSQQNIFKAQEQSYQVSSGTLRYSNGHYYVGQVTNKQRHGKGIFFDKDHNKLIEGIWVMDKPEGDIMMYNPHATDDFSASHLDLGRSDWIQFKGIARNGLKEGQGALFFKDGGKYIGQFMNDKAHGRGMYEYSNKQAIVGMWQHDQYIS